MTRRSRIANLFFPTVCLAAAPFASAQQAVLPAHFAAWSGTPGEAAPNALPPAVQRELGAGKPEAAEYSSGSRKFRATLEPYKDPTSAYAAYTAELQVGMHPTDVRPYSAVWSDKMLLLVGNFLLHADQVRNVSASDLRALASAVESRADTAPLPPIRNYLPAERLIQGTQRYALGAAGFEAALDFHGQGPFAVLAPEIGFPTGAEAMLAGYLVGPGRQQNLLIVEYPTPQLAEQRLRHIQSVLAATPALASTTVERRGSLLSLVLAPVSPSVAADLREQINYRTQVTWNEPSHTLTDPPWLLVVKNLFLGTFAFCGAALALGLAFGGVRVLVKKLLPGKVFDRPEDMEVLQLGLSGKRIDPRDFY
jgi:hypothetical protein